ncbi:hypothetical protein M011DRAFT_182539 [Sporormia fimetaria CBS 119925]|uniref:Uncharacterized protein n=1 Tax=Sporormia fimetaria CBS 119925 TaxID=1340428 RepID=A0A6A6VJF7_9PLEO|nr:hypothetical protein M011DRAFT_182539 [Sporormia fimetaria CBS 119925]
MSSIFCCSCVIQTDGGAPMVMDVFWKSATQVLTSESQHSLGSIGRVLQNLAKMRVRGRSDDQTKCTSPCLAPHLRVIRGSTCEPGCWFVLAYNRTSRCSTSCMAV